MNSPYDMANAMANRICGMPPAFAAPDQPNKQSTVPAGFYQYQYNGGEGITIDCHLEYEAAHDGGTGPNSDESYPESITLIYALVNGVDIAEVLSSDVTELIEEEALCSVEMDGWNSECDRAADRHEEREEA
jgi:hypothetical protein